MRHIFATEECPARLRRGGSRETYKFRTVAYDSRPYNSDAWAIISAKLNNVDPRAWLADVLRRIADHPASRLHELLPWNWARERERRNLAA